MHQRAPGISRLNYSHRALQTGKVVIKNKIKKQVQSEPVWLGAGPSMG